MVYYTFSEHDWKQFRAKLPGWQATYMDRLNREYIEILNSDNRPSEKFWELEKRLRTDKHSIGVQAEMRRSKMETNIISLLNCGAITLDDLDGFSDEFQERMKYLYSSREN